MRKPSMGQMVIVRAAPERNNGGTEAPAVVTRVHGDAPGSDGSWEVNVRVLLDASDAVPARVKLALYPDRETADGARPARTDTYVGWWQPA